MHTTKAGGRTAEQLAIDLHRWSDAHLSDNKKRTGLSRQHKAVRWKVSPIVLRRHNAIVGESVINHRSQLAY